MQDDRLFINVKPGKTFLDRLTGKTKVRTFFSLIFLLIATWDIRLIVPLFVLFIIALISIRPNWKKVWAVLGFIILVNIFNLLLMWLVEPDYGLNVVGGSTVLWRFNSFYMISAETMWYFLVRFTKFMATFLLSLVFIQSITPSEMAAGLYSVKVPYKACTIVSIAFRYIPDIARDYQNIRISMQARGLELDPRKASLMTRLKQNVTILAPLIITSFDRVGNIANAMDLRGFGKKKIRTYYSEHEDTKGDRIMLPVYTIFFLLFVAVVVCNIVTHPAYQVWCPWITQP
ncbi:MAG: energy-coupling factor transporter transmembrane protein EcfT [Lachnospiraceae bacterium]|nr:energy-coupling factor transporter transmembrane protein EcfT [Lachnospiraceae bacterium]